MGAADKDPSDGTDVSLIEAIVAAGRTVALPGKKYHPGETVRLAQADVDQLRGLGYLVNAEAAELAVGNGPTFTAEDGPSVKKPASKKK